MAIRRGGQPSIKVAAFGKHPGWDDHIEDIGLASDTLVRVKRTLYTEGIGGNIDAGSWEKLDEPKRLAAFRHAFVWHLPDGVVVGRVWSSRDGKGRSKYPMIVCAHASNVNPGWALDLITPRLADLERACVAATTAEAVKRSVAATEADLSAQVASAYAGSDSPTTAARGRDSDLLKKLAGSPDLAVPGVGGPDVPEGLVRILYEMERELSAYRPGTRGTRMGAPAPQHFRVPRCLPGVGDSARAWAMVLEQELMPDTPVLVLDPLDQPFVDIVVGDPAAASFYCVRCSAAGLPPTSEVPYSIEDAFRAGAMAKIAAWREGRAAPRAEAKPERESTPTSKPIAAGGGRSSDAGDGTRGKSKVPLYVGGAVLVVGVIVVLSLMRSGGGGATNPVTPNTKALPPSDPTKVAGDAPSKATPPEPDRRATPEPVKAPPTPQEPIPTTPEVVAPPSKLAEATPPPPSRAADVPAGSDPRVSWDVDARIARAREALAAVDAELAAESKPALSAIAQSLDGVSKRAKLSREMSWTAANADAVSKDVASVNQSVDAASASITKARDELLDRIKGYLAQQGAASPSAAPGLPEAWKAAIAAIEPASGWARVKARVGELSAAARTVDAALVDLKPIKLEPVEGVAIDAVEAMVASRRAAATSTAIDAALKSPAGAARGVEGAVRPVADWTARVAEAVATARQIADRLRAGRAFEDAADGASLKALAESLAASPAQGDLASTLAPLMARVEASKPVAPEAAIAALRAGVPAGELSRLSACLTSASGSEWPSNDEQFAGVAEVVAKARGSVAGSSATAARKAELTAAVDALAASAWRRQVADRGATEPGLAAIAAAARDWGSKAGGAAMPPLPDAVAYNAAVLELRRALGGPIADDAGKARVRAAAQAFEKLVAGMPEAVRSRPEAKALLAALAAGPSASPAPDVSQVGPGSAGGVFAPGPDGESVSYTMTLNGVAHKLVFRRIAPSSPSSPSGESGTVGYVCTSEVSVGLFAGVLASPTLPAEAKDYMPGMGTWTDRRFGVRTWEKVGDGIGPSQPAPPENTSLGWLPSRPGMANQPYYPASIKITPPTAEMPMQMISPVAAAAMAKLVGCRLPTAGEFAALLAGAASAPPPPAPANLRDATYAAEMAHLAGLRDQVPEYPAKAIFQPTDKDGSAPPPPAAKDDEPAVQTDDGVLWFVPVGEGSPTPVNVLGNVAEFVVDSSDGFDRLADIRRATIEQALGRGVRVVGGSALSPKRIDPMTPRAVESTRLREGYSDVGFRLAFTAPAKAAGTVDAATVGTALKAAGFIPVK